MRRGFSIPETVTRASATTPFPALNVSGAFISGGSQVGQALSSNSRWELQNFLAWQKGTHALKFGGKVRGVSISDSNPNNFGGTYVFTGGFVPTLGCQQQSDYQVSRYLLTVLSDTAELCWGSSSGRTADADSRDGWRRFAIQYLAAAILKPV